MKRIFALTLSVALLASFAMAGQKPKQRPKKTTKPPQAAPKLDPTLAPMVGLWTLRDGATTRLDIKMKFTPDGHFAFLGPNWRSAGKFRVADGKLTLEWANVDGQAVKPGAMRKDFNLDVATSSFVIDKYTYWKMGSPIILPAAQPAPEAAGGK